MRIALSFLLVATCLGVSSLQAQEKRAKTEDGKEVILKPDGTWVYVGEGKKGKQGRKARLAYTGKRGTFALSLNPDVWTKTREVNNPDAEAGFVYKDEEAYAIVIAERPQIPLATLKRLAVEKWQSADKNVKVVLDEKRTVNGKEALCLTAELEIEGIALTFHGLLYTGEAGSIQLMTWTTRNLFKELKPELEAVLNGFEVIEKK